MPKRKYKQYLNDFKNRSAKIPYQIYKKILEEEYGAVESVRSHSAGSKRAFTIGDEKVFVIHKPHKKDDPVGKWDHRNVLDLLIQNGLIRREEDEEKKS